MAMFVNLAPGSYLSRHGNTEQKHRCVLLGTCDEQTEFQCSRGKSCISSRQQCDGVAQCSDTSDEAECCE